MSYLCGDNMLKPAVAEQKSWTQRTGGVFKKGNEIYERFGAEVAILIRKDGVLHGYLSHDDFPGVLPGVLLDSHKKTPGDYLSCAEKERREAGASSRSPPQTLHLPVASPPTAGIGQPETPRTPKRHSYRVAKRGRKIQDRAYFTRLEAAERME